MYKMNTAINEDNILDFLSDYAEDLAEEYVSCDCKFESPDGDEFVANTTRIVSASLGISDYKLSKKGGKTEITGTCSVIADVEAGFYECISWREQAIGLDYTGITKTVEDYADFKIEIDEEGNWDMA